MVVNITPKFYIPPSGVLPGGVSDTSDSSEVVSSGNLIQPSKDTNIGGLKTGATSLTQGYGNDIFRISQEGIQLGGANFTDAPFTVDMQGNLKANAGTFGGSLTAPTGTIGGFTISATALYAGDGATKIQLDTTQGIFLGSNVFATAPFRVSLAGALTATNATITGAITATSGRIANWYINTNTLSSSDTEAASNVLIDSANSLIRLGSTSGNYLNLDGANLRIRSSNYVSGYAGSGFNLDSNLLEVGNIACRGLIRTSVFQKDVISVVGGNLAVLDGDVLDTDMTALDSSTLTTKGTTTFSIGDILRIKDGLDDEWMQVVGEGITPVSSKGGLLRVIDDATGDTPITTNGWIEDEKYGWYMTKAGTVSAEFDSAVTRTGLHTIKLSATDTDGNLSVSSAETTTSNHLISVKGSTMYRLQCYVKTNNVGTNGSYLDIRQYKDDGTITVSITATNKLSGTNDWTLCTISFTTDSLTTKCVVRCHNNVVGTISDAWFDNITLEEVSSITNSYDSNALYYPKFTAVSSSDNIDQAQLTSDNTRPFGTLPLHWLGQQFTPTRKYLTGFIIRKGAQTGTYIGNVTISIQADSGSTTPSGTDLGTPVTFTAVQWGAITTNTDYTVTYPLTLTIGGTYWIVIKSSTADNSNYTRMNVQTTASYPGGVLKDYDGANWGAATTQELYFKTLFLKNSTNFTVRTDTQTLTYTSPTNEGWADGTELDSSTLGLTPLTLAPGANTIYLSSNGFDSADITRMASHQGTFAGVIVGNPYVVTRDKGSEYAVNENPEWKKGATIVNYGQSGDGGVYMTASETNAPYLSIFDHAGSPWTTINTRLRIGNLNGFLGYTTDKYGIGIGDSSAYLTYDNVNGLLIKGNITVTGGNALTTGTAAQDINDNTTEVSGGKITTNSIEADKLNVSQLSAISADMGAITAGTITLNSSGYIKGGQTDYATGTGYFLGLSGGDYKFSIGSDTNYMKWNGQYLVLKGSFDVGTNGLINNAVYTVANLPVTPTTVGFLNPSAYE